MKTAITICIMFFLSYGLMAQEKTTLNTKDLNSNIEKYIKKNYEGYNTVEAFKSPAVYEMKVQKADSVEWLLFDAEGNFLKKETETAQAKLPAQVRVTLASDDVNKDITKYIKKIEYQLKEAYMYDEAYEVKVMKGNDAQTLLFDIDGKFVMKAAAVEPKPAETVKTPEPVKADTAVKK